VRAIRTDDRDSARLKPLGEDRVKDVQPVMVPLGSDGYRRHGAGKLLWTDAIQHLAEQDGAHWLIDAIASYQLDWRVRHNPMLQEIQFWQLRRSKGGGAVLTVVEDSDRPPVIEQKIEYTDFPLEEIKLYLEGGVLMLPSER
jgi:hypothetical protein